MSSQRISSERRKSALKAYHSLSDTITHLNSQGVSELNFIKDHCDTAVKSLSDDSITENGMSEIKKGLKNSLERFRDLIKKDLDDTAK